jgi:hypothetical protein
VHHLLLLWTAILCPGLLLADAVVRITEAEHEGRAQFEVRTETATYFYDRAGGGFSRLIDRDGRDWIAFKKEPLKEVPASAAAGFRGIPNLMHGKDNPDAGAGHPGFDLCESALAGADAIRTVSKSGRWAWTWRFTETNAVFTMEQADAEQPWWFLYEGTVGGRWSPGTHYWGTDAGGPLRDTPDQGSQRFGQWCWAYFGDDTAPRVLLAAQETPDAQPDTLWYMGSTADGLRSADGMVVFGFGRGPGGSKHLRGAGRRFILGLVEGTVKSPADHQQVAATADAWTKSTRPAESVPAVSAPGVSVSEVTLFGDMECFRVTTPSATYVYGKRGAGFASILDREGRDWISYRHGGKSAGEYRGLPKCGQPVKYFHCGYGYGQYTNDNWFTSTITLHEREHVRIHSETKDGAAACDWDFFPTHATMTLMKIPGNYWFLYEGTPGGALDTAGDFVIRPHGHRTPLSRPWVEAVSWVAFGAKESPQYLLLVNHQHDGADASYAPWPYTPGPEPLSLMTVFGFGRPAWDDPKQHTPPLETLPARFTIAITPTADEAAAQQILSK